MKAQPVFDSPISPAPTQQRRPPWLVFDRVDRSIADLPPVERRWLELLLLLAVALAARVVQFGNPAIQVDEQFYLMVGDRMLHGALPYVDIWDRKPIGLFLLYAAMRQGGGTGILAYQLTATAFATLTAFAVTRMASRIARPAGALLAGVLYLVSLDMFGGDGGQSPVFYNLPVAAAALILMRVAARPFDKSARRAGAAAMALAGVAIQLKYTAVFESLFFGLFLLWRGHFAGLSRARLLAWATIWSGIALLPTVLATLAYWHLDALPAFIYANFGSIFERGETTGSSPIGRLSHIVLLLAPLGLAAVVAYRRRGDHVVPEVAAAYRFARGWAASAISGVLVFGSYFDHYALPLIAPLAVAAAPVLADRRFGLAIVGGRRRPVISLGLIALLCTGIAGAMTISKNRRARSSGPPVYALADFIRPRLDGCLFVYAGEPILYHLTGSCLPTRWPFPDHLNNISEDHSIGVDPLVEVERIMAGRPHLVVSNDHPESKMNMRTWTYMVGALGRDYRPIFSVKIGKYQRTVFERRPGR